MIISLSDFASSMGPLGPWPRSRRVAVAVSGGADSLCLAWLARQWGDPVALIVDHGLRAESAGEAARTRARLAGFGVAGQVLRLDGLAHGPGLAARARVARYAALERGAAALGLADLLVGHHAGDQAETLLMRGEAGSRAAGLAGMAAIVVRQEVRVVRPLLGVAPERLRATLVQAGLGWEEDPSNRDVRALRPVLRARLAGRADEADGLRADGRAQAVARRAADRGVAETLARRVTLFAEGFARLSPGPVDAAGLGALLRVLGGQAYAPASRSVARLAADPRPATLGGVRILAAGRLGPGLLLVREAACVGPAVAAVDGAIWDGRFRLSAPDGVPEGAMLAGVGRSAACLRGRSTLPAAVLASLPGLWVDNALVAVPHIRYDAGWTKRRLTLTLWSSTPVAGAAWLGDAQASEWHHVCMQAGECCPASDLAADRQVRLGLESNEQFRA